MAAVADRLAELEAREKEIAEEKARLMADAAQEAELEKQLAERQPEVERMQAELAAQVEEMERIQTKLRELRGEPEKRRPGRPAGSVNRQRRVATPPARKPAEEDRPRREGSTIDRMVTVLRRSANGELPLETLTERMVNGGWETSKANKASAVYTAAWEEQTRRPNPLVNKVDREGKIYIALTDAGKA